MEPALSDLCQICDANAFCTNNVGSYHCECNEGYEGDGFNCDDKNDCEDLRLIIRALKFYKKLFYILVMIATFMQNVKISSVLQKVSPAHVMKDMMVMEKLVLILTNAMMVAITVQLSLIAIIL